MTEKQITAQEMKTLMKAQQGELDAVGMYLALAKTVKDPKDQEVFRQLAKEEGHHAAVFHGLTKKKLQAKKTKAILLPMLYRILGRKRLYPLIAKGEYAAERTYAPVVERFPQVESVQADERRHGDIITDLLQKEEKEKESIMKKLMAALLLLSVGCWIGIHRRVIRAYLTGDEMPGMPANHPKVFCHKA